MTASTVINNVVIRPAASDDFEWVADLMVRALSPFYDGDHRAHAQRIFDTHMEGGVDHVGHFSAGQYMFIAEQDGQRVGIIHVVEKKQETVKISPLIVSTIRYDRSCQAANSIAEACSYRSRESHSVLPVCGRVSKLRHDELRTDAIRGTKI